VLALDTEQQFDDLGHLQLTVDLPGANFLPQEYSSERTSES
jgi:hypothetical protein